MNKVVIAVLSAAVLVAAVFLAWRLTDGFRIADSVALSFDERHGDWSTTAETESAANATARPTTPPTVTYAAPPTAEQTETYDDSADFITVDEHRRCIIIPKTIAESVELISNDDETRTFVLHCSAAATWSHTGGESDLFISAALDGGRLGVLTSKIVAPLLTEEDGEWVITALTPREAYGKVIVIDAGHGGEDEGSSYGAERGVFEKDVVLMVARELYALFEANVAEAGVKAYMTRWGDETLPRWDRAPIANELGDLFVSIHADVDEASPRMNGAHGIFAHTGSRELGRFDISNYELAETLADAVCAATGANNLGVDFDDELTILMNAKIPAALVEIGYLTNADERARLTDEDYLRRVAEGLYDGISRAFEGK